MQKLVFNVMLFIFPVQTEDKDEMDSYENGQGYQVFLTFTYWILRICILSLIQFFIFKKKSEVQKLGFQFISALCCHRKFVDYMPKKKKLHTSYLNYKQHWNMNWKSKIIQNASYLERWIYGGIFWGLLGLLSLVWVDMLK